MFHKTYFIAMLLCFFGISTLLGAIEPLTTSPTEIIASNGGPGSKREQKNQKRMEKKERQQKRSNRR